MSWVDIHRLSYTYPGREEPVLKDISLSIKRGAFVVITGESGCGKSTLGKTLAGFLFQDEDPQINGQIIVNGSDMSQIPLYEASEHVAYVQQNPEDQFCTLSVADEIAFGMENRCFDPNLIKERIEESLSIVKGQYLKNRFLATLSGGEKQKIALASMLAMYPDVLILDEPTSNLDPIATRHVFETLHGMRKNLDLTVIIIEHKLDQLMTFSPQVFVMESGEVQPIDNIATFQADLVEKTYPMPNINPLTTPSDKPLIQLENCAVKLDERPILKNISFTISSGDFIALMGPNGSGKSTLLQTMMGFHEVDSGKITAFGKDLSTTKTSELVNNIGFIFQNPDHQLFMQSVWDEAVLLTKNLRLLSEQQKTQTKIWLEAMKLWERKDDHPQRLSYGEKRRLNLLSVILHMPKVLIIDEFLIGQDMANAHAWMKFLQYYAKQGHAVILVNHHATLTCQYCNRIIFLAEGEILVNDDVDSAIKQIQDNGYSEFLPSPKGVSAYA